jgi:hypothetical protein
MSSFEHTLEGSLQSNRLKRCQRLARPGRRPPAPGLRPGVSSPYAPLTGKANVTTGSSTSRLLQARMISRTAGYRALTSTTEGGRQNFPAPKFCLPTKERPADSLGGDMVICYLKSAIMSIHIVT